MHTHAYTRAYAHTHVHTCSHTESMLTYLHVEAHREPRHSHTQSPHAHTHTEVMHGAHVFIHTSGIHRAHALTWRHAWSPRVTCTRRPHMAGCFPPAEARTLPPFLPGPQQQELKRGQLGRAPMLGDTCASVSWADSCSSFLKSSLSS